MKNVSTLFSLQPLAKSFGAIVTDVRLNEVDDSLFSELYGTWLQYALLIFPGQHLSDAEQVVPLPKTTLVK